MDLAPLLRIRDLGACGQAIKAGDAHATWWFPEFPANRHALAKAIAICETCPVKADCYQWALEHREVGVWGGRSWGPRVHRATTRVCPECHELYVIPPNDGRKPETCGPVCAKQRHLAQQALADEARGVNVGANKAAGHGVISRYNKGCRCRACRRAARDYMARYRAAKRESAA